VTNIRKAKEILIQKNLYFLSFNEGDTSVAIARAILINLPQEDTRAGSINSLKTQFPVLL